MTTDEKPPERRRPDPETWRTSRTPSGVRPSARQQQRDARAYAERWYQAFKAWEIKTRSEEVPRIQSGGGSGGSLVFVVGAYTRGSNAKGYVLYTRVLTPMGEVSERALASIFNGDHLLERIRAGHGPATLLHHNGRGWNGERSVEYAQAVLAVAVALGDKQAYTHQQDLLNVGA